MSAQATVEAALLAALEAHAPLAGALNGIYARRPERAAPPFALLGETLVRDWSTKTEAGRELRLTVSIFDYRETASRLGALMAEAEVAVETMPRELSGWRIVSLVFLNGRILREREPWQAALEYRARVLAN